MQKLTRDEFLAVTGGREQDTERHEAAGAVLIWNIDGKVYEEWQPDIGNCAWFVSD